jgi:hypothetical protein
MASLRKTDLLPQGQKKSPRSVSGAGAEIRFRGLSRRPAPGLNEANKYEPDNPDHARGRASDGNLLKLGGAVQHHGRNFTAYNARRQVGE